MDYMYSGHLGCPGCGATIAMKFALKALGEKTMVVIPACCWGVIAGPYPQSSLKVPILQTAFATAGAAASGLRAALYMKGDTETTVVAWAGDGGTFDSDSGLFHHNSAPSPGWTRGRMRMIRGSGKPGLSCSSVLRLYHPRRT